MKAVKRAVSQRPESSPEPLHQRRSSRRASSVLDNSSFNNSSAATFRSSTKLTQDAFKQPSWADKQRAEEVTAKVMKKISQEDWHVPVNKESRLDAKFTSVIPFYRKGRFIRPFSLSSKAPFASSESFCFVRVNGVHRLVYGNNMEQLAFPLHQQAQQLYARTLARKCLKFGGI